EGGLRHRLADRRTLHPVDRARAERAAGGRGPRGRARARTHVRHLDLRALWSLARLLLALPPDARAPCRGPRRARRARAARRGRRLRPGRVSGGLRRGSLWPAIRACTVSALESGALVPIGGEALEIEERGIRFQVRLATSIDRKRAVQVTHPPDFDPFLPVD